MHRSSAFQVLVLLALVGIAGPALADPHSAARQVGRLNHEALDQFDLLEFEPARAKLLEAVKLALAEGLVEERVLARTYLHLAAVHIAGYKDYAAGTQAMQKALRIDPGLTMTPSIRNPAVLKAYDKARADIAAERAAVEAKIAQKKKEVADKQAAERAREAKILAERAAIKAARDDAARKAGAAQVAAARGRQEPTAPADARPAPPAEEPKPASPAVAARDPEADEAGAEDDGVEPDTVEGLRCPAGRSLPARRPLALRCALDKAVEAVAVFAFYRPIGRNDFTAQIMKKSPKGWWETVVAAEFVNSPGVEVYFEARDKKGKPLAADGNAASPKTLAVKTASAVLRGPRVIAAQGQQ